MKSKRKRCVHSYSLFIRLWVVSSISRSSSSRTSPLLASSYFFLIVIGYKFPTLFFIVILCVSVYISSSPTDLYCSLSSCLHLHLHQQTANKICCDLLIESKKVKGMNLKATTTQRRYNHDDRSAISSSLSSTKTSFIYAFFYFLRLSLSFSGTLVEFFFVVRW